MKRKTILGGITAIAVGATLVGGGTFAVWGDFDSTEAAAGAGILELNVESDGTTAAQALAFGNLAPGEGKFAELYIASSDAESVPDSTMKLDLTNLQDIEANGNNGNADDCTTNSEADAESPLPDGIENDGAVDCTTNGGEFADEAVIQVLRKAAASPSSCAGGSYGTAYSVGRLANVEALGAIVLNNDVQPGEGMCVRIELALPNGINNGGPGVDFGGSMDSTDASQGDKATFDVTVSLEQNV